jgi:pantetheine-phosphate adenylyltransferase
MGAGCPNHRRHQNKNTALPPRVLPVLRMAKCPGYLPDFSVAGGSGAAKLPPMRTVIYPGSFDPLTNGHLDIVHRAARLFDRVIVAVARNESKNPLFSLKERERMVARAVRNLPNVETDTFEGLLVEYAEARKAQAVIRGLRAVSDFEFEFQLALMNRKLSERIETIFMMPRDTYTFLSSRIVKEISHLGGDVSAFVPPHVRTALASKLVPRTAA